MKNIYSLILLLFLSLGSTAQIITIPDANFKAKLLQADITNSIASSTYTTITPIKIDVNNNGEIEQSEVLAVKALDVSNSNIVSLVGIVYFTNLRNLNCSTNLVNSLDVNSLPFLKRLDCSHNLISNLNCQNSNNTIDYFDSSYNNLTSLILPNFFEYLDMGDQTIYANCSHNQLTSVVFSSNEQLSGLDLSYNNFASLTFPVIEILGSIDVSNNPLTSINFTNLSLHSQVPDFHYGFLFLNNTNLTTVIIPFDISFGSTISDNQYLTYINFKNSQSNIECYYQDEDETIYICDGPIIENNPLLDTICCDINEQDYFSTTYPSLQILTDCSLTNNYIQIKQFSLFPNPTSSILNIVATGNQSITKTTINNVLGQTILTFENTTMLDIISLTKGTYLITVETISGKETQRIIKL